jgi:predicted nucleic acid-binding protein
VLNTVLVDAGPLIALFDKNDTYHKRIKEFIAGKQFKFISTIAVFTEVLHMLDFDIYRLPGKVNIKNIFSNY